MTQESTHGLGQEPEGTVEPVETPETVAVHDLLPLLYRPRADLAGRVGRAIGRQRRKRFLRVALAMAAVLALAIGLTVWSTRPAPHEDGLRSSSGVVAVPGTALGDSAVETRWSWGLTAAELTLSPGTLAKATVESGQIELTLGSITATVDHARQRQALTIRTPQAVATVTGTAFTISVGEATTRLQVEHGSVQFAYAGHQETVTGPGALETPNPTAQPGTSWIIREVNCLTLTDHRLLELSALAADPSRPDRLWGCGDHGNPASLFALDPATRQIAEYPVAKAVNHDWEDLAPMSVEGRSYLAIADIGKSRKDQPARILLIEPNPPLVISQTLVVRLPANVLDLDCLAWDGQERCFYLVGKDGEHPLLRCPYTTEATTLATVVATVTARRPTALAIDPESRRMALLDEDGAITVFGRTNGHWDPTRPCGAWKVRGIPLAQAMTWSDGGTRLWVSGEGPSKPLYQLSVEPAGR